MKRMNIIKISLDIVMTVVFVLLYNKMVIYGLTFHEVAGLAIGAIFIIHTALNRKWVKQVTLNIFSKKVSLKTKLGYWVDVLLLLAMGYIIVSGILISKVIFPNLRIGNEMFFKVTHISTSYIALLLIGVHLGLHWGWVMNTFKRIFRIPSTKKAWNYAAKAAVVIALAFGIYSMYSTNYVMKLPLARTVIGGGQLLGPDRGMKAPQIENGAKGQVEGRTNKEKRVPNTAEGIKGLPKGKQGLSGVNPLNVIATNLGIITVFTMLTYYMEKLLMRKRAGLMAG